MELIRKAKVDRLVEEGQAPTGILPATVEYWDVLGGRIYRLQTEDAAITNTYLLVENAFKESLPDVHRVLDGIVIIETGIIASRQQGKCTTLTQLRSDSGNDTIVLHHEYSTRVRCEAIAIIAGLRRCKITATVEILIRNKSIYDVASFNFKTSAKAQNRDLWQLLKDEVEPFGTRVKFVPAFEPDRFMALDALALEHVVSGA